MLHEPDLGEGMDGAVEGRIGVGTPTSTRNDSVMTQPTSQTLQLQGIEPGGHLARVASLSRQ